MLPSMCLRIPDISTQTNPGSGVHCPLILVIQEEARTACLNKLEKTLGVEKIELKRSNKILEKRRKKEEKSVDKY